MKNESLIYFAKCVFGLFFLIGNLCLFGYLFSKNDDFAVGGFFLLIYGTVINLFLIIALAVYGFAEKTQYSYCVKAIGIICCNIPIALLYAFIGLSLN